jgi:hypothetical protein
MTIRSQTHIRWQDCAAGAPYQESVSSVRFRPGKPPRNRPVREARVTLAARSVKQAALEATRPRAGRMLPVLELRAIASP